MAVFSDCSKLAFMITGLLALYACLTLLYVISGDGLGFPGTKLDLGPAHPYDVSSKHHRGAIASAGDVCSKIGADVIEKGANAVDAAIAAEFCLGVMHMWITGLGGGGFALVRDSKGAVECVDFRETAPAAAHRDMFKNNTKASMSGGLASAVPGALRGLEYLHTRYGSMSWADLVRPSIELSRNGFVVTKDLEMAMDRTATETPWPEFLVEDETWAKDFAPNGKRIELGGMMTRKRYANFLEEIAEKGPNAFYRGPLAEKTIDAIYSSGGIMTLEDMRDYEVAVRPAIDITYRDYKVYGCPLPSGSPVTLMVMNIMAGYPQPENGKSTKLTTHRLDEAMKFGYGARAKFGDPEFSAEQNDFEASLLRAASAANFRQKISDDHTLPLSSYNPDGLQIIDTPGTSHLVTADANGMAVSLTSTINLLFGSQVMVPDTGLIINNEMNDFSIPHSNNSFGFIPSPANYILPHKRPLSSLSPIILDHRKNGSFYLATGAAGGSRIITATIQALWNMLDLNMTPKDALKAPRFHDQLIPDEMMFEYAYDNATIAFLQRKGHRIVWKPFLADVHVLRRVQNHSFEAEAEPRIIKSAGLVV